MAEKYKLLIVDDEAPTREALLRYLRRNFQVKGASDGAEAIEYIASEKVALSSDKETALQQIVMQRFLAGFMTDGIESWSDWRRYNIPVLPMLPVHEINLIDVYPYRMQYADVDKESNEDNVNEAISTWLGGKDDRWSRVWWDVKDNI